LRSVLVQIGKQGLARNPAYSNRALGIERGSRIGTKQPLSDEAIRAFQERMGQLDRPGIGETLYSHCSMQCAPVAAANECWRKSF
jgi:hypothetical protein